MGFLDALLVKNALTPSDFERGVGDGWTSLTRAGQTVNVSKAMRLVAVYACVTLIADAIRALPVDVLRRVGADRVEVDRRPRWVESPNPDQTWGQFLTFALHSLLTHGNTYVWIAERDVLEFPQTLYVVHPDDVTLDAPRADIRLKRLRVNGKTMREFTARHPDGQVLHILGHTMNGVEGLSPIGQAREAIGGALATEQAGNQFWSQGGQIPGVITMPPGSNPSEEQLTALGKKFRRRFAGPENAWKPIVLANGADYKPITLPNDQAQFIETRKFSVEEIARLYRVPPHLIGDVERSTSWGTGIEQQNIGFVQYTLMPWLLRLEESFSLLLPRGQFIKFNVNGLLRGDSQARAGFYTALGQLKAIMVNEIRGLEDLPPLPDGDQPPPAPNESIPGDTE